MRIFLKIIRKYICLFKFVMFELKYILSRLIVYPKVLFYDFHLSSRIWMTNSCTEIQYVFNLLVLVISGYMYRDRPYLLSYETKINKTYRVFALTQLNKSSWTVVDDCKVTICTLCNATRPALYYPQPATPQYIQQILSYTIKLKELILFIVLLYGMSSLSNWRQMK